MKRKSVVVTALDIANGERKSYCECPLARAVRRAFRAPIDRKITVRHEAIIVGDLDDEVVWMAELPPAAERFIARFDKGRTVKPTTFQMTFR